MIIDVSVAAKIKNKGKITEVSSIGIVLQYKMEEDNGERELGYVLESTPIKLARINAVKFGMAAVNFWCYKHSRVRLWLPNPKYLKFLLKENNRYMNDSKRYKDQIFTLRKSFEAFKDISVFIDDARDSIIRAKSIAGRCLETRKEIDNENVSRYKTRNISDKAD